MMIKEETSTVRVIIAGRVQRIGFRYWVIDQASSRGLHGWVRNHNTGEVEAVFSGPASAVEDMIGICHEGPDGARVDTIERFPAEAPTEKGFNTLPTV